jgi:hypothetical protein
MSLVFGGKVFSIFEFAVFAVFSRGFAGQGSIRSRSGSDQDAVRPRSGLDQTSLRTASIGRFVHHFRPRSAEWVLRGLLVSCITFLIRNHFSRSAIHDSLCLVFRQHTLFTDVVNYFEEMSLLAGAISLRHNHLGLLRLFNSEDGGIFCGVRLSS